MSPQIHVIFLNPHVYYYSKLEKKSEELSHNILNHSVC